jgi:predicted metal-dependent HD superfamily phosphohydrolase
MADELMLRWQKLWQRFGVEEAKTTGENLLSVWQQGNRHYHSVDHLQAVLRELDWAKENMKEDARAFDLVELALWYHDAIYDAKAKDNEEQSAQLFERDARKLELPEKDIADVANLIRLTAGHAGAKTFAEKLMMDCDLAILGADRESFDRYDRGIAKEYNHVAAPLYALGRRKVLKGFLDRLQIFQTPAFREKYESQARENLARAVGLKGIPG